FRNCVEHDSIHQQRRARGPSGKARQGRWLLPFICAHHNRTAQSSQSLPAGGDGVPDNGKRAAQLIDAPRGGAVSSHGRLARLRFGACAGMIVNSYAVLDAFVSLLRLGLGLLVLWLSCAALRRWARHPQAPEDRKALEDRCYLLYLLAGLLLVLNVAAWPLF